MTPEEIVPDLVVYLEAQPGQLGILTGKTLESLTLMVEVDWGERTEFEPIDALAFRRSSSPDTFDATVDEGRYGTIEDLRNCITHEKLKGSLTDVFYSMKTSEIDFYPHQFKPVLKFVNSRTNRLLIADEVGLGKTIEAGLIWTECQARHNARRLLIICPPTLCLKWERELQTRFHIPAETGDAQRLLQLMEQHKKIGPSQTFAFITSYHALRPNRTDRDFLEPHFSRHRSEFEEDQMKPRPKLLRRLMEWDLPDPFIDLVVFDEAHSMKNTASASYLVGDVYSSASGGTLCLSATPIHNKSRDLYALLRILDPNMFREQYMFDVLRIRNAPAVRLSNLISRETIDKDLALEAADALQESAVKRRVIAGLKNYAGTPGERVQLRRELELLNELGSYINRTRKRDAIQKRVKREAVVITVEPTSQEKRFYEGVLRLIRHQVQERGDTVTSFHLISPALLMASSLPVIVSRMRAGEKWGGIDELEALEEDELAPIDPDLELKGVPQGTGFEWVRDHDFEKEDTKYKALENDLIGRVNEGKIIVFAFFKGTIYYLARRLERDGFKVATLTGDIQDRAERERILQDFESDTNQILLCSEIGAEGIDLQFCRIVINYDLPWNPMRVEQRIGRVDRLGQEANSILIVNFKVLGTIDAHIYHHLYEKIGIFKSTIGDLEGIIGDEVNRLTTALLKDNLTDAQVEEIAEQTAEAIENQREHERELEESSGALLAHRDYLDDQVGSSQRLGRFIKPAELRRHLDWFFSAVFSGTDACQLMWDSPQPDCLKLQMSFGAWEALEAYLATHNLPFPHGFNRSRREVTLTMDPTCYKAWRRKYPRLIMVSHIHPLIRWVTSSVSGYGNKSHGVSGIKVKSCNYQEGLYFYLIYRQTIEGLLRREELFYAIKNLSSQEVIVGNDAEELINHAVDSGVNLFPKNPESYLDALVEMRSRIGEECRDAEVQYAEEIELSIGSRRQQIQAHFDRKIEIENKKIEAMQASATDKTRGIRLAEGARRKWKRLLEKELAQLSDAKSYQPHLNEVACGIVEVHHA